MPATRSSMEADALAPASAPWAVRLAGVTVRYPNGVVALKDVSLDIAGGEMVSIVGLSGSGKSSLIRTINGLVPVTSGEVEVGGTRVDGLAGRRLRALRGDIGMIFQGFNLAKRASVLDNVLVGRLAHTPGWRTFLGMHAAADREIAFQALESVGILPKVWARASTLSGGQQQRVAIARALAQRPRLVLADEPVASLDPPTAHGVMGDLRRINRELGITVLTNLHLLDLAREYGDRMIGLRAGEVVYDGPAATAGDDVFEAIYGRSIRPEDTLG
ncbi:phosphonate ABC transporter ATP-binding protein [Clavibacter michiganensis]|uniref:phosphonate ABC transporter ATP-binding protein n=1 Tax=Clavibacter michiganensis TaxID=28447 RepID=UPI000A38A5F3|nr:phosphonate ABC transporter ATP-binding protein [Clavibacter michiganensis]MDO4100459.1 phosphonate ABC transporter ATP-binding protein [Clavibacter michiganensis]MDO4128989.1 phosphonate ABC transporter ATP-binding protein [Clavibacter michiganensis]NIY61091.1 phosphonate ABC transporter ATP-binding protein [Clavibacter michiganensis subsp. michiganensis]OUE18060.1 Phosphate-import ATP-binding protein PhnC [Clavibacter michiganensis subsp. michiganensis]QXP02120.1 phosphonate ABC transport